MPSSVTSLVCAKANSGPRSVSPLVFDPAVNEDYWYLNTTPFLLCWKWWVWGQSSPVPLPLWELCSHSINLALLPTHTPKKWKQKQKVDCSNHSKEMVSGIDWLSQNLYFLPTRSDRGLKNSSVRAAPVTWQNLWQEPRDSHNGHWSQPT